MSVTIFQRIAEWLESRPAWQQDALRRICVHGNLTEHDIVELTLMCRSHYGIKFAKGIQIATPIPLDLSSMPIDIKSQKNVKLFAISKVKNVNRLAKGQELTFGDSGLTVIYGDNGTGKSGYCRILKQVCRARAQSEKILPDVFESIDDEQPAAKIDFALGEKHSSFDWTMGCAISPGLANISFFDSDCASVHITEENELAYTPNGLDVLVKLVECCRKMRHVFEDELRELKGKRDTFSTEIKEYYNTGVSKILEDLSCDSNVEEIKRLSTLSITEERRTKRLQEVLSQDSQQHEKVLQLRYNRIEKLMNICESVLKDIGEEAFINIKQLWRTMNDTKNAATLAATKLFTEEPLPNVGSDTWKQLWEAARSYSEKEAYIGKIFPVVEPGSICVLCQQELGKEASNRLFRFEEFVKGKMKQKAETAKESFSKALEKMHSSISSARDYKANLNELELENENLAKAVRRILVLTKWRYRSIVNYLKKNQSETIYSQQVSLKGEIKQVLSGIFQKIETCIKASKSEEQTLLKKELLELEARKWLALKIDDIEKEIVRLQTVKRIEECIHGVDTTGITRKNNELTNEFVTDTLKNRFVEELKALGLTYLDIELVNIGGQYGSTRYQLKLTSAKREVPLFKVLSEGEHRCIALAAFLSELATSPTESALIFDDPVSSLDHGWRQHVAERLVEEALKRQLIVFTHDIVFLHALWEIADSKSVTLSLSHLISESRVTGICLNEVPWVAMTVSKRVGYIKNQLQNATSIYNNNGHDAYEPIGRHIYGLLRESWERAVEEVLFGGAVVRFGRQIQTKRLRYAMDIQQTDIEAIEHGMTKCSRFLQGHDQPFAVNEKVPLPDELKEDIETLEAWIKAMKPRRQ